MSLNAGVLRKMKQKAFQKCPCSEAFLGLALSWCQDFITTRDCSVLSQALSRVLMGSKAITPLAPKSGI